MERDRSLDEVAKSLPRVALDAPTPLMSRYLTGAVASGTILCWFSLMLGEGNPPYALYGEVTLDPVLDVAFTAAFAVALVLGLAWLAWMVLLGQRGSPRTRALAALRPVKVGFHPLLRGVIVLSGADVVAEEVARLSARGGFVWAGWTASNSMIVGYALLMVAGMAWCSWARGCLSGRFEMDAYGFVPTSRSRLRRSTRQVPWFDVQGAELVLGPDASDEAAARFDWYLETRNDGLCWVQGESVARAAGSAENLRTLMADIRRMNDAIEARFPSSQRRASLAKRWQVLHPL